MKTTILITAFAMALIALIPDKALACETPPVAVISPLTDPYRIGLGDSVRFSATGSYDTDEDGESIEEYSWSFPGGNPASSTASRVTVTYDAIGTFTASLTVTDDEDVESEEATREISVVKVDRIQYNDPDTGYTDISDTMYVHKGTTVTFKAIKDPPSASWPEDKPVWGGSAGASGTGETKAVTFNTISTSTTDYKTVTAECGNTETVNVVVFEFDGTFTPDDPFTGRSLDRWGLEEEVTLEFTTSPTGITATQAGGLEWTWAGVGDLTNRGTDGTADYDAEHLQGGVTFRLEVVAGASAGNSEFYWHDVIKPTGTRMTRVNPGTVWHINGFASAGIKLYYWLDPTDVSFSNLTFGEGSCPATSVSGFYLTFWPWNSYPNGSPMPGHTRTATFVAISGGNSTTGCQVVGSDSSSTGAANPYAAGSFTYVIPSEYKDDASGPHPLGSQTKVGSFAANGDATNTKGGQSGSAALNDPTSGY